MISRPRTIQRIPVRSESMSEGLAISRLSRSVHQITVRLSDYGKIVRPGQSIYSAIISFGADGGRVILAEGTHIVEGSIPVDRPNVSIVAASPHRTLVKRTITTSDPLFLVSANYSMISGIRFDDGNSTGAAVKITGNYGSVSGCRFDDVYKAVEVTGSWCRVSDNLVVASRSYPIHLTSSSANTQVNGNSIVPVTAYAVYVEGSTPKAVITGNIFDMTNGNGTASYSSAGSAENYVARGNAAGAEDASNIAAAYNRRP